MRPFVHDRYAPLSHKSAMGTTGLGRPGGPSWVPDDDRRRLMAYQLLAAYRDNVMRHYLPDNFTEDAVLKYREYGHAGRIVVAARSSLLGDEQTLAAPILGRDVDADTAEQTAATKALDWLREWADKERLWLKMALVEQDAVGIGDGVYVMRWDSTKQRPRLKKYDPGFYFPDLDSLDEEGDEFPRTVHMAWEEQTSNGRIDLHRLTWRLGLIRPQLDPDREFGTVQYLYDEQGRPVPQDGDRLDADGFLTRQYAWDTRPSRQTCHFTHAVWDLSKVRGTLYDLDPDTARYVSNSDGELLRERDLRIDFVPVVHVPNTPSGEEHFGQSVLMLIAQVLDDLAYTDTDLAESGALVGSATLVTKGGPPGDLQAGPGPRLDLPVGGSAEYLDTSRNLDALIKLSEVLKDTLSENSRVSKVSLGRVDASDAPSGIALALSFSPEEGLIRELRQVRDEKYPLLLRFALRFAQGAGLLEKGPTPLVTVQFGSFLPADQAQAVEQVSSSLEAGAMSTHTAVVTLQRAGFPIVDAEKEVERIRRDQAEQIATLLDLGPEGEALVWKRLGLHPPEGLPDPPPAQE